MPPVCTDDWFESEHWNWLRESLRESGFDVGEVTKIGALIKAGVLPKNGLVATPQHGKLSEAQIEHLRWLLRAVFGDNPLKMGSLVPEDDAVMLESLEALLETTRRDHLYLVDYISKRERTDYGRVCSSPASVQPAPSKSSVYSSGSGNYGGGTGGCFIATAAYGSPASSEIRVLRRFRDKVLSRSASGRWLVQGYYSLSPPIARYITYRPALRRIVRALLAPLVWIADKLSERR